MVHDFETYFKKLSIEPKNPSLSLVEALQKKHIATFSFNNIDVLLGTPISLEIEKVIDKIVLKNLGGYCFEHNYLMYEVLKSLGFNVRILMARVLNNKNVDVPRTHRITLLEWKGKQYIVDVGFGAMSPPFVLDINVRDEREGYRIVSYENGNYQLELLKEDGYFILYRFDLASYTESDCLMGNFYSSCHPNAVFVNNFVVSLRLPDVTLSFRNGSYQRISKNKTEIFEVKNKEQLQLILNDEFLIPLDVVACTRLFEFMIFKNKELNIS